MTVDLGPTDTNLWQCMSHRDCLLKDPINNTSVYCCCCSFLTSFFLSPSPPCTLWQIGRVLLDKKCRIQALSWLHFPAVHHRALSPISPSELLCLYNFLYISYTEGRPTFFPMRSLLHPEKGFFSVLFGSGCVGGDLMEHSGLGKEKNSSPPAISKLLLPLIKNGQGFISVSHSFLYLSAEPPGILWFKHFILL